MINSLFEHVLNSTVSASVLILLVLAVQWLLRGRISASWNYGIWAAVLVVLLVPKLPVLPVDSISTMDISFYPVDRVGVADAALGSAMDRPLPAIPDGGLGQESSVSDGSWLQLAFWVWGVGVVLVLGVIGLSFAVSVRRIRATAIEVDGAVIDRVQRLAMGMRLRRVPGVLCSSRVQSPAVCGLFRPVILLSEGFAQTLSVDEQEFVIRHELMHLRRHDLSVNAVLCLLLALHWFNPLYWWAFFRIRADREMACDASVICEESPERRSLYGKTLLKLDAQPVGGLALGFVGFSHSQSALRRRVLSIANRRQMPFVWKYLLVLIFVSASVGGILTAQNDPAEVSEDSGATVAVDGVVVLDPGHGGHDPGARNPFGVEKDYNLDVAKQVQEALRQKGVTAVLTRDGDYFVPLEDRSNVSNQKSCQAYVSIHFNSSQSRKSRGMEVYCPVDRDDFDSYRLGASVIKEAAASVNARIRKEGSARFKVFEGVEVPVALIECGYLSNNADAVKVNDPEWRGKLAKGIAEGIVLFLKGQQQAGKGDAEATAPKQVTVPIADGFDYPVGMGQGDAEGYFVYREFSEGGHLGDDWNGIGGGNTDLGDPVYAIGDGVVVLAEDYKRGWGNVVITRHSYVDEAGDTKIIDACYAHLQKFEVNKGDVVSRGQQIGAIGRGPEDMYTAHLHFEIRKNLKIGMRRDLFPKTFAHYHDPKAFIEANRPGA